MSHSQWSSFHLFRTDPIDDFLLAAVAPFVGEVFAKGLASAFFFIRYREGGPHVRLRLRTTSPRTLVRRTHAHFGTYFEGHPSLTPPAAPMPPTFVNDSVLESSYEPEVSRYGGLKCISISERHFEASSRAVLGAIAERHGSYESAIGTAIQLHIIFAYAMGFGLGEAAGFFSGVSTRFVASGGGYPAVVTADQAFGQFAESFEHQRDSLVNLHNAIWSALGEGQEFEQEWANRWLLDNVAIARRLRRARGLKPKEPWSSAEHAILTSYFHMTNNRLGLLNRDEAYVGYLLSQGLAATA
jgi:thiopeptide-type bacteriocin biosynthesis protein